MFTRAANAVTQRAAYFSELDMLGDADFGVSVSKGFELVLQRLSLENGDPDVGRILTVAGDAFSMEVGSTIGVLFGCALTEAGRAMDGRKNLDSAGLATILRTALVAVETTGHATVGDKTLLDALEPAAIAAEIAASRSEGLGEALARAAKAAEAGSEMTVNMVARVGRSSYLGERSRGHADPGAAFIAYFLRSMSQPE
ncbi:MAG: DAK2 domain-containing protein [Nitrososphaerales archaeon]|jgi:dihydroxyacetone kinase-like protein